MIFVVAKKRRTRNEYFLFGLVLLICLSFGLQKKPQVLGERDDVEKIKVEKKESSGRDRLDVPSHVDMPETPLPSVTISAPEYIPVNVPENVSVPENSSRGLELKSQDQVVSDNAVNTNNDFSYDKPVDLAPVSDRSVVSVSSVDKNKATTRSTVKSIGNTIKNFGKGEFLTKPSLTPTEIKRDLLKTDSGVDEVLPSDADVFYKVVGDKVLLGATNNIGSELKIKDEDLRSAEVTMNKILNQKQIQLSVTANNEFALVQGGVYAVMDMPVSVNIDSYKVYLDTASGKKELKVLPKEAVRIAVEQKAFETLNKSEIPSVEDFGEELAYKVGGDKTYKVFGLVDVKVQQNVYVTAETGEVIEGNQPLLTRIVRLISL